MSERDPAAARLAQWLNVLPIAVFCLWLAAFAYFWASAFGPMRSYAAPEPRLAAWPWFVASLASGMAVLALPAGYYRLHPMERSGRLHERLGAKAFRGFVTNGDRINRIVAHRHPGYRVHSQRDRIPAAKRTSFQSERSHLVCFVAGMVACVYAAAIGWWGWAVWMAATNTLGNFYPALVQRHTRARLARIAARRARGRNPEG